MSCARAGFTLAEISIGAGLMMLVCSLASGFLAGASRAAASIHGQADALASMVLGADALRHDAARLVYREATDLCIGPDGRSLSLLVVSGKLDSDLWSADGVAVGYRLVPAPGLPGAYLLERTEGGIARTVPGCVLSELTVRFTPCGVLSARTSYLDVTLRGVAGPGAEPAASRLLLPVQRIRVPGVPLDRSAS